LSTLKTKNKEARRCAPSQGEVGGGGVDGVWFQGGRPRVCGVPRGNNFGVEKRTNKLIYPQERPLITGPNRGTVGGCSYVQKKKKHNNASGMEHFRGTLWWALWSKSVRPDRGTKKTKRRKGCRGYVSGHRGGVRALEHAV